MNDLRKTEEENRLKAKIKSLEIDMESLTLGKKQYAEDQIYYRKSCHAAIQQLEEEKTKCHKELFELYGAIWTGDV